MATSSVVGLVEVDFMLAVLVQQLVIAMARQHSLLRSKVVARHDTHPGRTQAGTARSNNSDLHSVSEGGEDENWAWFFHDLKLM